VRIITVVEGKEKRVKGKKEGGKGKGGKG